MDPPTVDESADATRLQPATSCDVLSFRRRSRTTYLTLLPAVALLLALSMCIAKPADAQQATASSQTPATAHKRLPDILLPATLTAALDSKKKKPGDEVVLKSVAIVHLADGRLIPRGAKIVGHVTEATTRSGSGAQSSLGIVIDKIDLADGTTLAVTGKILAVAPNPNPPSSEEGGVGYGGMNQTLQHATPSAGGTTTVIPMLTEDSVGVQGIKNLQLGPDGVFKSDQKTVKLGFGSQIVLKAQANAGS